MIGAVSVRGVEPSNFQPGADQPLEHWWGLGGRTDGGNDVGPVARPVQWLLSSALNLVRIIMGVWGSKFGTSLSQVSAFDGEMSRLLTMV
jgi:hypothetical protein